MDVTQQAYSMWMEKVKYVFPTMLTRWMHYPLSFNPNEKEKTITTGC